MISDLDDDGEIELHASDHAQYNSLANGVAVLKEWPAQSPDIIEQMWVELQIKCCPKNPYNIVVPSATEKDITYMWRWWKNHEHHFPEWGN